MIYKQGRKHKVLVCPVCGVLATNPISDILPYAGAALGALVPVAGETGVSEAAGYALGEYAKQKIQSRSSVESTRADTSACPRRSARLSQADNLLRLIEAEKRIR